MTGGGTCPTFVDCQVLNWNGELASLFSIQTPTDGGVWATQWTAERFRGNLYTVRQKKGSISFCVHLLAIGESWGYDSRLERNFESLNASAI